MLLLKKAVQIKNMDTKAELQEKISTLDDQIDELEGICLSSIALRNKLEEQTIKIEKADKHSALKAASERQKKLQKLQETIDISCYAQEGLNDEKRKLESELREIFKTELEAERDAIKRETSELMDKINHQIYQLQKDILPLKDLIKERNKTYGNGEIYYLERWMYPSDIDGFAARLDEYFLCFYQENLRFTGHINSGFGNSEGRANLKAVKQNLEEKINEQ